MKKKDIENYINRYESRLRIYGESPETLGWGKHGRQEIRFSVLCSHVVKDKKSSVLDVGCGFADLYPYLKANGWDGSYHGIDIVPSIINIARQKYKGLDLRLCELSQMPIKYPDEKFDYVIASGIFNAKLIEYNNLDHITNSMSIMASIANKIVCVDFLSTHVDYQKPEAWHTNPLWALEEAFKISPRVMLRHDYMPYEFSLFIFIDTQLSNRNVYLSYDITANK